MSAGNPPAALTGRDAQIGQFRRLIGRLSNGLNEPKGLIFSPDHGAVDFTVPHFSPFMRRRYPLEAVADDAPAGGSER